VCRVLVGKPEGRRPVGRPRRRRDSDGSRGSGMLGHVLNGAGSGYGKLSGTCECGNEPSGSIKGGGIS